MIVWECDCVGESGSMWVWQPCLIVSLCVCVCGWARGWGVCDCVGVCGCDCVGVIAWVKVGGCGCGSLD